MPSPLQISLKVVGLDQAKSDLQQFAQGGKRSFTELAAEAKKLSDTSAGTDQALRGVANRVRQMSADLDPAAAASIRLRNSLTDVERALKAEIISAQQASTLTAALRREHEALARSSATVAAQTGQTRFALQNLSFQLNDIATSLASGGSPMRVLAQQGGQVVQVFQQGGGVSNVLGAAGTAIRGMISPTTLAVAGVAALAGGFALLLSRAQSNAEQLRQFNNILTGFGTSSLATAGDLQQVVRQLKDMGVAASDADAAVKALARNPRINPAAAGQISTAGLNIGARLGLQNPSEGIGTFAQAITGGVDSVVKLGLDLNALTTAEATNIRMMDAHGERAKALNLAIQTISNTVSGEYKKSLTDSQAAINSLSSAWDHMLTRLADTGAVQGAREAIINMMKGIAAAASGTDLQGKPDVRPFGNQSGLQWFFSQVLPDTAPAQQRFVNHILPNNLATGGGAMTNAQKEIAYNNWAGMFHPGTRLLQQFETPDAGIAAIARQLEIYQSRYGVNTLAGMVSRWAPPNENDTAALIGRASRITGLAPNATVDLGDPTTRSRTIEAFIRNERGGQLPPAAAEALGRAGASSSAALPDKNAISEAEKARRLLTETTAKDIEVEKQWGIQQQASQAYWQKYREVVAQTGDAVEADAQARIKMAEATAKANIEIGKATTLTGLATEGERAVAEALKTSEAEALKVAAAYQARAEVMQGRSLNEAARAEELLAANAAKTATELQRASNDNQRRVETVQLEASLQGQLPEVIQQQVTLLQAKQELQRRGVEFSSAEGQNYLKSVDALAQANRQLAETDRAQQRMNSLFSDIGNTISNSIGSVLDSIFDPSKAMDWGKAVSGVLRSVGSSLIQGLLVRPLTGDLLSAFGASPTVTNQFGSLSSGSSLFSGSNLLSAGGLLKDVFGIKLGGEGGIFSGASSFLNDTIGVPLGFAPSGGAALAPFDALGIDALGLTTGTPFNPGIFGGATFGSFLGGAGLGFGAGSLLNGLIGGNKTFGTVGSGLGSLAGAAIGSIIPGIGTLLGGLLGGAGGGLLGGLFGNNKPSNASAGANFDLSSFKLTAGFAGGNQQIDQATQQVAQGVQQFLALLKTTGGALTGNVLLQNGVNTGFTADSSLPQYSGRFNLGKDPTAALQTIELALSRSLTGISDTMRTVLDQIGDPAELESAIAFANAYDKLSDAAKDAFATVEQGKEDFGPFRQAMDAINATFGSLTDQANRFGLALDPINAALAEATSRLQGDFTNALQTALNEATGAGFINQLQTTYDNYLAGIKESQAIGLGGDRATQDLLGQVATAQLNAILRGLDQTQLDQAITHFTGLNDIITSLAQSAETAATANDNLAAAQEAVSRTTAAVTNITQYVASLKSTPGVATSPLDALNFSQTTYDTLLKQAQGGDLTSLEGLTAAADTLVKNASSFYGATVTGAGIISQIEQDLAGVASAFGSPSDPVIAQISGTTAAVAAMQASNDNWSESIFNVMAAFGDTNKSQMERLIAVQEEQRDLLRLWAASQAA